MLRLYGMQNWIRNWITIIHPSLLRTAPFPLSSLAIKIEKYRKMKSLTEPPNWKQQYQELFIPLSKGELLQHLLQEFHSSPSEEAAIREFAFRTDFYISYQYDQVLNQMQELYHHIQSHRDTPSQPPQNDLQSQYKGQEIVRILEPILDQANFSILSEDILAFSMAVHNPKDTVKVRVDLEQYAFIRFWALGHHKGKSSNKDLNFFTNLASAERHHFKRVVLVAQTKEGCVVLKSFKDTPLDWLEYLLPGVKTRTSKLQLILLNSMVLLSGMVTFINVGMEAASYLHIAASSLLLFFIAFMAHRTIMIGIYRRRLDDLNLIQLLHCLGASNNSELITTLVKRAQEEHTKEVLLAHSFLRRLEEGVPSEESDQWLKKNVESWISNRLGYEVSFNGTRALQHHDFLLANMAVGPLPRLFKKSNPHWIRQHSKSLYRHHIFREHERMGYFTQPFISGWLSAWWCVQHPVQKDSRD